MDIFIPGFLDLLGLVSSWLKELSRKKQKQYFHFSLIFSFAFAFAFGGD
jgi:hypothetical protein